MLEAQPTKNELDEVQEVVNEQELKYWKAVNENPTDFTSWTYLLQFVEQEVCSHVVKLGYIFQSRPQDLVRPCRSYKLNIL